jgi:L-lactate permease
MFLAATSFTQQLQPLNSVLGSTLVALLPLALLLVLLAVMRLTAWLAVIIGAVVTIIMAITIWGSPAGIFNYSGMASTLAYGFSRVGTWFILLAPILGWIGVALSGSNTSTNALFGGFQYAVGGLLRMPLLLPLLNSAGAEVGKPVAPQTTSVGFRRAVTCAGKAR